MTARATAPAPARATAPAQSGATPTLLLVSVFVIATCGLVYELIAGTLASYLLGDSVTQFSTVIGVYLSAMGIGAYLSARVERDLLALFGGRSQPVMAHLIESGKLTMDDVKEAEKALRKLERKDKS